MSEVSNSLDTSQSQRRLNDPDLDQKREGLKIWLEAALHKKFSSYIEDDLRDGVELCNLMLVLKPDAMKPPVVSNQPFKMAENLVKFNSYIRTNLDVRRSFQPDELIHQKNLYNVFLVLEDVKKAIERQQQNPKIASGTTRELMKTVSLPEISSKTLLGNLSHNNKSDTVYSLSPLHPLSPTISPGYPSKSNLSTNISSTSPTTSTTSKVPPISYTSFSLQRLSSRSISTIPSELQALLDDVDHVSTQLTSVSDQRTARIVNSNIAKVCIRVREVVNDKNMRSNVANIQALKTLLSKVKELTSTAKKQLNLPTTDISSETVSCRICDATLKPPFTFCAICGQKAGDSTKLELDLNLANKSPLIPVSTTPSLPIVNAASSLNPNTDINTTNSILKSDENKSTFITTISNTTNVKSNQEQSQIQTDVVKSPDLGGRTHKSAASNELASVFSKIRKKTVLEEQNSFVETKSISTETEDIKLKSHIKFNNLEQTKPKLEEVKPKSEEQKIKLEEQKIKSEEQKIKLEEQKIKLDEWKTETKKMEDGKSKSEEKSKSSVKRREEDGDHSSSMDSEESDVNEKRTRSRTNSVEKRKHQQQDEETEKIRSRSNSVDRKKHLQQQMEEHAERQRSGSNSTEKRKITISPDGNSERPRYRSNSLIERKVKKKIKPIESPESIVPEMEPRSTSPSSLKSKKTKKRTKEPSNDEEEDEKEEESDDKVEIIGELSAEKIRKKKAVVKTNENHDEPKIRKKRTERHIDDEEVSVGVVLDKEDHVRRRKKSEEETEIVVKVVEEREVKHKKKTAEKTIETEEIATTELDDDQHSSRRRTKKSEEEPEEHHVRRRKKSEEEEIVENDEPNKQRKKKTEKVNVSAIVDVVDDDDDEYDKKKSIKRSFTRPRRKTDIPPLRKMRVEFMTMKEPEDTDVVFVEEAKEMIPEPFPKPIYIQTLSASDYKEFMIRRYEYEQWENKVVLLARKLKEESSGSHPGRSRSLIAIPRPNEQSSNPSTTAVSSNVSQNNSPSGDSEFELKAKEMVPEPFPKPLLQPGASPTAYKDFMVKRFEYEQWENRVALLAKKLSGDMLASEFSKDDANSAPLNTDSRYWSMLDSHTIDVKRPSPLSTRKKWTEMLNRRSLFVNISPARQRNKSAPPQRTIQIVRSSHQSTNETMSNHPLMQQLAKFTEADSKIKAIEELISTEISYLESIQSLMKIWLEPLILKMSSTTTELKELFGFLKDVQKNLQSMESISNKIIKYFSDQLLSYEEKQTKVILIAQIFLDLSDSLKETYSFFGVIYDKLSQELRILSMDQNFSSILQQTDPSNMQEYTDYLIMPIQRLPRYSLLLENIIQTLTSEYVDHPRLLKALKATKVITTVVNDKIKRNRKISEFQEMIAKGKFKDFGFVTHNFVYSESMMVGASKNTKLKPTWMLILDNILYSSRKDHIFSLEFVYLIEDQRLIIDGQECIQVNTPEDSMWIRGESEKDMDFLRHLRKALISIHSLADSKPITPYKFSNGRIYEGEWSEGKFHGIGLFVAVDKTKYSGYWNCKFASGVGIVVRTDSPSSERTECGWSYLENNVTDLVLAGEDGVPCVETQMTQRDLGLLQSGQTVVKKNAGELILGCAEIVTHLFQVRSGVVREEFIRTIRERNHSNPSVFGEFSLFNLKSGYSSQYIAEGEVEVTIIQHAWLQKLFMSNVGFCKRFWLHIAGKLALLVIDVESEISGSSTTTTTTTTTVVSPSPTISTISPPPGSPLPTSPTSPTPPLSLQRQLSSDLDFQKRFGLESTDYVLKAIAAVEVKVRSLNNTMKMIFTFSNISLGTRGTVGTMYLSPFYVCFGAQVFGSRIRRVFRVPDISDLSIIDSKMFSFVYDQKQYVWSVESSSTIVEVISGMMHPHSPAETITRSTSPGNELERSKSSVRSSTEGSRLNDSSSSTGYPPPSTASGIVTSPTLRRVSSATKDLTQELETVATKYGLQLTENDWKTLLEGAVLKTFKEGEVVLEPASNSFPLLQIVKGALKSQTAKFEDHSEILGVVPYLTRQSSLVLTSDSADTRVYFFEEHYLKLLHATQPLLAAKFNLYLCSILIILLSSKYA